MLKRVEPLRNELKSLERQAEVNVKRGDETTALIQQLERSIASYKEEYALLISQAQAIKTDLENVQSKVDRSIALLSSLAIEKERWEGSSETFRAQMATIVGDTLLSSAFLAYAGYFDQQYRQSLFSRWSGHLLVIMAVVESFHSFPVDGNLLDSLAQMKIYKLGSSLFSSALWIALPMMALLLFVNLTMGIISRVAPQMNIYAIGFPVTLTVGLLGITATLPMLEQPVLTLMQQAIDLFATK